MDTKSYIIVIFKIFNKKIVTSTISLYDKCVVLYMYIHTRNNSHKEGNISLSKETRFVYVEGEIQMNDQK